jgi:hypothetical protein
MTLRASCTSLAATGTDTCLRDNLHSCLLLPALALLLLLLLLLLTVVLAM